MSNRAELLDVETEEERQDRLQSLLEGLEASRQRSPPPSDYHASSDLLQGPRPPHLMTFPAAPPEHLLQRVHAFLQQLEASNAALATVDSSSIDIENFIFLGFILIFFILFF
ncbi:hypothetical protein K488DRAFT_89283 [Vararia minispora EC-137]|uniref:Uncharacterized protein n=1 Tax=Vararia minispora EC-137 TaxID=1314806 RepID=A0ACB8QC87_9AGAM|nr:hypothetical protein K488DRAFT_89283 [Vararia minispora EC-137]